MVSPQIIEEIAERYLNDYFDLGEIFESKEPSKEFLKQLDEAKGWGVTEEMKRHYSMANKLFKNIGLGALNRKEFNKFKFGGVKELEKDSIIKGIVERTGTRQIISKHKGKIKSYEKWKSGVRMTIRDSKGRFVKKK